MENRCRPTRVGIRTLFVAAVLPVLAGQDGVDLLLERGAGSQQVRLLWTGGNAPYELFRSTNAQSVLATSNVMGQRNGNDWVDEPPDAPIQYYQVNQLSGGGSTDCNVRQAPYSAVGDGVADDRLAFVNAITNCGSLSVPHGTYRWSSGITTDRPIRLIGSSPSATVIKVEGSEDGLVIGGTEVTRPSLQELTLLCSGCSARGIVLTNTKGALVQHVVVGGFPGGGITINGLNSLHVSLRDVRVAGPVPITTSSGIYCEQGTSARIENAYVSEYETLIRSACDGLYASGNILEGGHYGYYRDQGEMLSIGDWIDANTIVWAYTIGCPPEGGCNSVGIFHPRGVTPEMIYSVGVPPNRLVFVLSDLGTPPTPFWNGP